MRRARLLWCLFLGLPLIAVPSSAAVSPVDCLGPASTPMTFTAEWNIRDMQNQWCAGQRNQDQATNPLFMTKMAEKAPGLWLNDAVSQVREPERLRVTAALIPGSAATDPNRTKDGWKEAGRGRVTDVMFISSFTGARLTGEIWLPPSSVPGPYPGVIIATGGTQQYRQLYYWAAQGLAESGYMVMTYDSQGQGGSESYNHTDDGGDFCTSRGCPGPTPPPDSYSEYGVRDAIRFFLSTPSVPYTVASPNATDTNLHNPASANLDPTQLDQTGRRRLGLAGHSLGGANAQIVGQLDPRVAAIVSWDASIYLPAGPPSDALGAAHAPTMIITADYNQAPEHNMAPPDPMRRQHGYRQLRQLCLDGRQCLDAMQVALRAATHYDWTHVPYGRPASRLGERVSMYYTLAWFDAYLKGAGNAGVRSEAMTRLKARTFDNSADRTSIGTGLFEPISQTNKPYLIAGAPVRDRLSFYYRSSYFFKEGFAEYNCEDFRIGC